MRRYAVLLPVLLVLACATSRPKTSPAPTMTPDSDPTADSAESAVPVQSVDAIGSRAACAAVMELHETGDLKPAVDSMRGLRAQAISCPPKVEAAFEAAQETLRAADELARQGLEHRDRGEIGAARRNFAQALAIYPKYYWVRALENALPSHDPQRILALRRKALELCEQDRLDESLALLEQALELEPSERETIELISETKAQIALRHLSDANRAASEDRLAAAAESVIRALGTRPEVGAIRQRLVEDARNLGLSLFSAGELIEARELWKAALDVEPANSILLEYLAEVEVRLDRLATIQDSEPE